MKSSLKAHIRSGIDGVRTFIREEITVSAVILSIIGSAVLALGLCHIHAYSDVTEGGVLGMTLLLDHHFGISPAASGLILNILCYVLGWKYLGRKFLVYSAVSSLNFSLCYSIFETWDPLFPNLVQNPLLSAVVGAAFVGVGCGLCVMVGGAPGGDDALAMALSRITGKSIQKMYMMSDLVVLVLSLTYIPLHRILYSLLTVTLSGQIIGWVVAFPNVLRRRSPEEAM